MTFLRDRALASIVRYEMQRVASSTRGSTSASVGQASMQRVHVPQRSNSNGASGSSMTSISSALMKALNLFPVSEGNTLKVLIVDDDPKAVWS